MGRPDLVVVAVLALVFLGAPAASQGTLGPRLELAEATGPEDVGGDAASGVARQIDYEFRLRIPATGYCTGDILVEFAPAPLPAGLTLVPDPARLRPTFPQTVPATSDVHVAGLRTTARLFADAEAQSTDDLAVTIHARAVPRPADAYGATCNLEASDWAASTHAFDFDAPAPPPPEPATVHVEAEPTSRPMSVGVPQNSPAPVRLVPFLVIAGIVAGLPAVLVASRRRAAPAAGPDGTPPARPSWLTAAHARIEGWLAAQGAGDDVSPTRPMEP